MTMKLGGTEIRVERKNKVQSTLMTILGPALALVLAFLVTAIIILVSGKNPLTAFAAMFEGAFGSLASFNYSFPRL